MVRLLHSDLTAIHLVTLLEALPVQETLEAIAELREMELPIGSVIINRNIPAYLPPDDLAKRRGRHRRRRDPLEPGECGNHVVRQRLRRTADRDH